MGDEETKAGYGIAIDAYLLDKTGFITAQEMTETPMRHDARPGLSLEQSTTNGENGTIGEARPARRQRPYSKTTVVKLISTNATSSAFPESFGLSLSYTGRWLAAFSSSVLYLISTLHLPAYKGSCRAFRIRRKPLAVAISESGRFAVLTTSHKVDVYQCGDEHGDLLRGGCRKLETIHLDNEARTLAFAKCGEVVAVGSDAGLEIKSLAAGSRESDKRYITCSPADRLMFSRDSRALLATSVVRKSRFSTFIGLTESFEDAFVEEEEAEQPPLGKLWITQLLFPERVPARQAALLPSVSSDLANNEILAFESHMDHFRVFDVTMKRFTNRELGTPREVIWTRHHKLEEAVPAVTTDGSYIACAIRSKTDKEVWVYHTPESWWESEPGSSPESGRCEDSACNNLDVAENIKLPTVEEGSPPETITYLQWVESSNEDLDRLVALVSTINIAVPEDVVPIEAPAVSGKVFLFDFADTAAGREEQASTIIVDLNEIAATEGLTDEVLELDREVDLMRRRTQIQRNRPPINPLPSPRSSLRRSMSSGSTSGGVPTLRDIGHSNSNRSNSGRSTGGRSNSGRSARRRRSFSSMSSANDDRDDAVVAVDEPYSQSQPRSQFTLHRAATIAANAPANRLHLRALPDRPLEYRRADGLREMPHESDADNWVPPPPVYSERPDNVVSHPLSSNPQAAASYVPQPQRSPSITRNRLSRPLSIVPPIPPIPQITRSQYSPSNPAVLPQHPASAPGNPAPRPDSRLSQSRHSGHTSSWSSSSTVSAAAPVQTHQSSVPGAGSRRSQHRNADSSSSASTLRSHNTIAAPSHAAPSPIPQQGTQPQPQQQHQQPLPNAAALDPAPAMAVMAHGLPPTMTPPSPVAEFVRPRAIRLDTPTPGPAPSSPNAASHRLSGSGEQRHAPSPLPSLTAAAPSIEDSATRRRPVAARLATIASVADYQHQDPIHPYTHPHPWTQQVDDGGGSFTLRSAHTTPETPTGGSSRRQWWRAGGRSGTPPRSMREGRESRVMQYAPGAVPGPAVVESGNGGRVKEKGSGFKCVVM